MGRNSLQADDLVSCIFTCTDDLDAEFPAVAARHMGLSGVPLLCAREIEVPGSLPRVIRLLLHCYADPDRPSPPRVPSGRGDAAQGPGGSPVSPGLEFNARLRGIPVYPAAATYAFEGDLVKLASNETPFPPHPQVLEAVEAQLRTLNRYPDPDKSVLRRRISDRTGVPPGRVAVGNGSCELLLAAAEAMLEPDAEIVYAWPSFSIYPHMTAMSGARAITVPLNDAGEHDLEAMASEVTAATRIVLVCNPNNPSATALTPAVIDAFAAGLPRHVAVILDEAYVEFSTLQDPDESIDLLARHPNLVLLRTFSKVYGLCGLRVGLRARLRGVPARRRPGAPALLGQRPGPGGGDRGAEPRGRGRAAGDADGGGAHARRVGASRNAASRAPTARRTSPGCPWATATRKR